MPKDWEHHKAEIERLYMVERRPLNDVRDILKTRFGFDASIRAYRMKLDEWRLWKNNSKNDRRTAKTGSRRHQSQPALEISDSEDPVQAAAVTVTQPPRPVDVSMAPSNFGPLPDGLTPSNSWENYMEPDFMSGAGYTPTQVLEQILRDWTNDGSFLKGALKYLNDNRSLFRIQYATLQGTTLFQSIAANVASNETFPLAKFCLEIDFEQAKERNFETLLWPEPPEWLKLWRAACASHKWEEVVKNAHMIDLELNGPGPLFTSTALPFLSEKMLEQNLERLELWNLGEDQFDTCLRESMAILSSFKTDMFDVDKIWYKRFLQLNQSHIAQAGGSYQLEDYRKRFSQLRTLHESINQSEDPVQNLLSAANVLKESKVILDASLGEDASHANSDSSARQTTPMVVHPESPSTVGSPERTLVEDMYKKWSWGKGLQEDVQCILTVPDETLGVYNSLDPEENIFILISRLIPPRDRVCFTVAILAEVDEEHQILRGDRNQGWFLRSWAHHHDIRTLRELLTIACLPDGLGFYLDDRIGVNAVQLVLDAFIVFLGNLTLSNLKSQILRRCRRELDFDVHRDEYMSILDELEERKLQVDQKWYRFLGRMLSWETDGPDYFRRWYSEEDSDASDDDSSGSEVEGVELRTPEATT